MSKIFVSVWVLFFGVSSAMASSYPYFGKEFKEDQLSQCQSELTEVATSFNALGATIISQQCRKYSYPNFPPRFKVYLEVHNAPRFTKLTHDFDDLDSCNEGLLDFQEQAAGLNLKTVSRFCQDMDSKVRLVADVVEDEAFKELNLRTIDKTPYFDSRETCETYLSQLVEHLKGMGYQTLFGSCRKSYSKFSPRLTANLKRLETSVFFGGKSFETTEACHSGLAATTSEFEDSGFNVLMGMCRNVDAKRLAIEITFVDRILFSRFKELSSFYFESEQSCLSGLRLEKDRLENEGNRIINSFCDKGPWPTSGFGFKIGYRVKK